MEEKKPPEKLEEIKVIQNFCGVLKQKNQKNKCVQFYEELAGLPDKKRIPMEAEKI